MDIQVLLLFNLLLCFGHSASENCDISRARVQEGNLGQSGEFKWLGVLNVHLNQLDRHRIGTTGIVLIKIKHALASADDVVRIPQQVFKSDTQAMFLVAPDTPWFVKPASYVTHPEYEYSTLNSIAIIKLEIDEDIDFSLTPICLPTSRPLKLKDLHLTGFTYENEKLEKVFYNITNLDKRVCEVFYYRTELLSKQHIPSAYLCGFAPSNVTQCVWDNGMALVSNVTGVFHLYGFGVHGPGCAAPARFINLFPYLQWIHSVTGPDEDLRRNEDHHNLIENIPIHELYTMEGSRRLGVTAHDFEAYPFDVDTLKFHHIEFTDDNKTVTIVPSVDQWEAYENACNWPTYLMYKEHFEVREERGLPGKVIYKLSLFDLSHPVCACVRLTVEGGNRSDAVLSFKESINFKENTQLLDDSGETPEEIIKVFPQTLELKKPLNPVEAKHLFKQSILKDDTISRDVMNCELYIQFEYNGHALMKFEMFAPLVPTTTTIASSTTEITTPRSNINKKLRVRLEKPFWGMMKWEDKMMREVEGYLVTEVEEGQENKSGTRGVTTPGAVLLTYGLISVWLRKALLIH